MAVELHKQLEVMVVEKHVLAFAWPGLAAGLVGQRSRVRALEVRSNIELVVTLMTACGYRNPTALQNEKNRQKAGYQRFQGFLKPSQEDCTVRH